MTKKQLLREIYHMEALAIDMCGSLHPDVIDEERARVATTARELRHIVRQTRLTVNQRKA